MNYEQARVLGAEVALDRARAELGRAEADLDRTWATYVRAVSGGALTGARRARVDLDRSLADVSRAGAALDLMVETP